jgi:hypothetical protein
VLRLIIVPLSLGTNSFAVKINNNIFRQFMRHLRAAYFCSYRWHEVKGIIISLYVGLQKILNSSV